MWITQDSFLHLSESPSSLGLGGIRPGGESPPKEKKKKEEDLSLCKQLQSPERSVYFGAGKGGSDNPVSHNDLESNRIWQYLWAVVCFRLQR